MSITLGIAAAVILFGSGLLLGLYLGERGRRRDVLWWVGLQNHPSRAELRAEVVASPEGDADERARRRAEIESVEAGLWAVLEREGRAHEFTREAIHEEAMQLVTQMDTEAE